MIVIAFTVLLLTYFFMRSRPWRYKTFTSPGLCLPFIGHSYKLMNKVIKNDPVNGIWNLYRSHQRDGMLYFKSFGFNNIWIGDFKTVKYIFNHADGNSRSDPALLFFFKQTRKLRCDYVPGVLFSEQETWQQQRRFTLKTLKDFGFGKKGIEETILEEVTHFKLHIENKIHEPFDFGTNLNLPIINALWRITVGQKFDYNDPKLLDLCSRITDSLKIMMTPKINMLLSYPVLFNFKKLFNYDHVLKMFNDVVDMMEENIEKHKETLDRNDPRDFTDLALIEIENTTDESSSFYGEKGFDGLKTILLDLFIAGSETTSTTLTWAALYMVRYPEIQEKVQKELDSIVGPNRSPNMADKPHLHYTEAVIMEIQRHSNIVPLGLRHIINKDVDVKGQTIPAGTHVYPMMAEILKGDNWGDGTVFRPERFINEEGNIKKYEEFMPFSIGKRQCLGETLAKTELFLFFTSLVHQYKFLPEVEKEFPLEQWEFGVTCLPKPFKVKLKNRF